MVLVLMEQKEEEDEEEEEKADWNGAEIRKWIA